ncbi:MAG TPA: hypothetical protein VK463_10430 [Desulfomonilaceae bacterium]|nr:hypothetical protein [Desulfomonilaceae bacterium]
MMLRIGLCIVVLIAAAQGVCFGQGLLDSVFGPGGLGVWGGDSSNFGNQQPAPGQFPQQPAYPQQQSYPGPAAPGYPQNPFYNQQGVYGDWQNYPPATMGAPGQEQYPDQQYEPPQYSSQVQTAPPVQYQQGAPQQWPAQGQQQQPPLRPGQYAPGQPPVPGGPPQVRAEDLPSGAVRITTTTPDGTTVEFYPPNGVPSQEPGVAPPQQPRHLRARPASARSGGTKAAQSRGQAGTQGTQEGNIAMPKPVEIPQGQDPRHGWGAAINRAPMAPETR